MHRILSIILLLVFQLFYLQSITLNKVEKINENQDKFFYKIEDFSQSQYLGEVEVNGFSGDDVATFGEIYKKAKQIGANSFAIKPIENVDGSFQAFNPSYYLVSLYYTKAEDIKEQYNVAYLISSATKAQKININNKTVELQPRSFIKLNLLESEVLTISTRKLLGSSVKLTGKANQSALYFAMSNFSVRSNDSIYGGLNLKSGDITGLEKSFGMFLTATYQEQKLD